MGAMRFATSSVVDDVRIVAPSALPISKPRSISAPVKLLFMLQQKAWIVMPAASNLFLTSRKWSSGVSTRQLRRSSRALIPSGDGGAPRSSRPADDAGASCGLNGSDTVRRHMVDALAISPRRAGPHPRSQAAGAALARIRNRTSLIQRKAVQRVAGGDEHVLAAVDQVRFRRVRHLTELRMPERLAVGRIERDEISGYAAAKQQLSRRRHATWRRTTASG